MKPIIVIVGNCQSSFVASFLKTLPEISEQFEIRRFRNYRTDLDGEEGSGGHPGDLPAFVRDNKHLIAAFLRQASHNWIGDPITQEDFKPDAEFVEFPVCLLNYIWPLSVRDHRFEDQPQAVRSRFPYSMCDGLLTKLVLEGVPEGEIVDAYMAHDITAMFKLDRLRRFNDVKMRDIDSIASFPLWDFVHANMESAQLFRTMNHPSGTLMAELLRRLTGHLRLVTDQAAVERRLADVERGPGVADYDAPVHPDIVKHFGMKWAEPNLYQFWDEGEYSFQEHLIRLYQMRTCLKGEEGIRAWREGDLARARTLLEEAVAEAPRSAAFKVALADAYARLNLTNLALDQLRQAWAIGNTLKVGAKLARLLLTSGASSEAETIIAHLASTYGETIGEVTLLRSEVLKHQRNPLGALEVLRAAADSGDDYRVWMALASSLIRTGDAVGGLKAMETAYRLSGMAPALGKRLEILRATTCA